MQDYSTISSFWYCVTCNQNIFAISQVNVASQGIRGVFPVQSPVEKSGRPGVFGQTWSCNLLFWFERGSFNNFKNGSRPYEECETLLTSAYKLFMSCQLYVYGLCPNNGMEKGTSTYAKCIVDSCKTNFLVRISVYILCFHNLLDITKVTLPLLRKDIVNSSIRMDECNIFNFLHVQTKIVLVMEMRCNKNSS